MVRPTRHIARAHITSLSGVVEFGATDGWRSDAEREGESRIRNMALTEDEKAVFDGVVSLLYESDEFEKTFDAFAREHCAKFDHPEEEEQKLVYNDIYIKYRETFEKLIETYLASKNTNVEQFFDICTKVVDGGDEEREGFLPMLHAITDYEMFISLMFETKEKMQHGG